VLARAQRGGGGELWEAGGGARRGDEGPAA
jgi:hypothetical protein